MMLSENCRQIDGSRGFTHATLTVEDDQNFFCGSSWHCRLPSAQFLRPAQLSWKDYNPLVGRLDRSSRLDLKSTEVEVVLQV